MNDKYDEEVKEAISKKIIYDLFIDHASRAISTLSNLKPDIMKIVVDNKIKVFRLLRPHLNYKAMNVTVRMARILALIQLMVKYNIIEEDYLYEKTTEMIEKMDKDIKFYISHYYNSICLEDYKE